MKPHFRKKYGVWSCVSWSPRVAGCGYTVRDAWNDWFVQLTACFTKGNA